jgi:molybdopterin converting factor small subunit
MSVTVEYLGILAEVTGKSGESIEITGERDTVLEYLREKHPAIGGLSFVLAHNGKVVHGDASINDGDRISLIPPAPGG